MTRRIFHPELGQFFRKLREDREMGLRQAADMARRRGLKSLTLNSLGKLERGGTKNPEPELLRDIATLYEMTYEELVGRFVEQRFGTRSDLIRHWTTGQSAPQQEGGSADVPASAQARIRELEQQLAEREAFLDQTQDAARALWRLYVERAATKDRNPGTAKRRRRGPDRKVG